MFVTLHQTVDQNYDIKTVNKLLEEVTTAVGHHNYVHEEIRGR
jgi:hypothetical protein